MGDLIVRSESGSVHATTKGDKYEVAVLIKGLSGKVYVNKAETLVMKAVKKIVRG